MTEDGAVQHRQPDSHSRGDSGRKEEDSDGKASESCPCSAAEHKNSDKNSSRAGNVLHHMDQGNVKRVRVNLRLHNNWRSLSCGWLFCDGYKN